MSDHGETSAELDRLLQPVGRVPRILTAFLLVLSAVLGWLSLWAGNGPLAAYLIVGLTAIGFGLSLRVKASLVRDRLVVRSYLNTYVVPLDDVLVFMDTAYSGFWNRSADTDSWLNLGMRMVDVVLTSGSGVTLRATMARRKHIEPLVEALNARVQAASPGGEC